MSNTFYLKNPEKHREILEQISNNDFPLLDGLRILVVDDNADHRYLVTVIFEEYQAQVKTVVLVDEAIKVIQDWNPDVLISEINLQHKDGRMLIRSIRIKEVEMGGFLPAIALTCCAFPFDYIQAIQAGFQRLIPKPFDPNELVAVVATLTGRTLLGIICATKIDLAIRHCLARAS